MVAALAATSLVAAQAQDEFKPKAGDVTTDFSLFANGLFNSPLSLRHGLVPKGVISPGKDFEHSLTGLLKGRYFFQDDLALRLSLGLNNQSMKFNDDKTNDTKETIDRATTFFLGLGVEKHFVGTNRLSPYVGAELHLGSYSSKSESHTVNTNSARTVKTDVISKAEPGFVFGGGLFLGADYYIAPKVFLGLEAGLNIDSKSLGKSSGSTTITTTPTGGAASTTTTPSDGTVKRSGASLSTDLQVGFKIGFVF